MRYVTAGAATTWRVPLCAQRSGPRVSTAGINPDVALESYTMNITTMRGFAAFKDSLLGRDGRSRVDLVLSCVDNYEARMTINEVRPILDPFAHH